MPPVLCTVGIETPVLAEINPLAVFWTGNIEPVGSCCCPWTLNEVCGNCAPPVVAIGIRPPPVFCRGKTVAAAPNVVCGIIAPPVLEIGINPFPVF